MYNYNVIKVTNKEVASGVLTLTVNPRTFENYCRYKLCGVQFLPPNEGTEEVIIVSNDIKYPLIDKAGNIVTAGRLPYDNYCLLFGNKGIGDIPHFVVLTCIPTRTRLNPPIV